MGRAWAVFPVGLFFAVSFSVTASADLSDVVGVRDPIVVPADVAGVVFDKVHDVEEIVGICVCSWKVEGLVVVHHDRDRDGVIRDYSEALDETVIIGVVHDPTTLAADSACVDQVAAQFMLDGDVERAVMTLASQCIHAI